MTVDVHERRDGNEEIDIMMVKNEPAGFFINYGDNDDDDDDDDDSGGKIFYNRDFGTKDSDDNDDDDSNFS